MNDEDFTTNYLEYKDLPRRSIIRTVQKSGDQNREIKTYGVISRVKAENKWLLVRTRHTAAISYLLHGAYQPVHFENLLKSLTLKELTLIQSINNFKDFSNVYTLIFNSNVRGNYGYTRLMDLKEELQVYEFVGELFDTVFSIPKGRKIQEESSQDTALREFYEETGITANSGKLSKTPIIVETTGFADRKYSIELWGFVLQREIDLTTINYPDKREIIERKWIELDPNEYPNAVTSNCIKTKNGDIDKETLLLIKKAIKSGVF